MVASWSVDLGCQECQADAIDAVLTVAQGETILGSMEDVTSREWWTLTQLGKAAGISGARVRQLLMAGEFRALKVAGRWLVRDAEARRWLAMRREQSAQ